MPKPKKPLKRDGDSLRMIDAVDAILKIAPELERPTDYQLKIGILNFYPEKGTIYTDGTTGRHGESGLRAFIALLEQSKTAKRQNAMRVDSETICVQLDKPIE